MKNWIFVVTRQKEKDKWVEAREIFEIRMKDKFWGLAARTPNRKNLKGGDRVVFYVGKPDASFVGTAVLASESLRLDSRECEGLSHGKEVFTTDYGVKLTAIEKFDIEISAKSVADLLSFIENPRIWYTYLQGGIRGVIDADFEILTKGAVKPKVLVTEDSTDIESANDFALEAHLEEFLASNWSSVPWGRNLKLYETGESNGRQFPAGTWNIDFLSVDQDSKALVVIELQKGQTSDATVGQVLRYMGWVRENVAETGQKVEGLIICREISEALRLAVQSLPGISVLTYSIDFHLVQEPLQ